MAGVKNPKIILDGNEYTVYSKQNNRSRWRCNWYYKTKCKSRLITYGKVVQVNHTHNHSPPDRVQMNACTRQIVEVIRKPNLKGNNQTV